MSHTNRITDEVIEYVGILAKLELNEEERKQAGADMERMLNYIDKLNELDTEGVEPMVYPFEEETSFLREDEVTHVLTQEEALRNAGSVRAGHVHVPKVVK